MASKVPPLLSLMKGAAPMRRAAVGGTDANGSATNSSTSLPAGALPVSAAVARARTSLEAMGTTIVVGEVTRATLRAGNWYVDLKDAQATLSVVAYARDVRGQEPPEAGEQVCCVGKLTIYQSQGRFQLLATRIDVVGEGAAQRRLDALKRKLEAEGLFAPARKRVVPMLPRRIGVVTSLQGAALGDVLRVLQARAPRIPVLVSPTRVQGEGAAADVADALRRLSASERCDVILLVRGGGAAEDLRAFQSEAVVRAIVHSAVPVVVGVGHQMDFTLACHAADVRAATPSQAAELASPDLAALSATVATWAARLRAAQQANLHKQHNRLLSLRARLPAPASMLRAQEGRLALMVAQLRAQSPSHQLNVATAKLNDLHRVLTTHHPRPLLSLAQQTLQATSSRLQPALDRKRDQATAAFVAQVQLLEALSPLAVLQRGYAVVRDEHGTLAPLARLHVGQDIDIRMHDGRVSATVTEVHPTGSNRDDGL
jgi:exodeoxyribonuclease VII large subunit